jgi:hypothetical protein
MAEERFEGSGPVARYWLANCEGFSVRGGVQGTVEELLRDADPFVTSRLVVRRGRRRTVVPVEAVAVVIPAERTVLVERRRSAQPARARTAARSATRRTVAGTAVAARTVASAVPPARSTLARTGTRVAARTTTVAAATTRTVASAGPPTRSALAGASRRFHPLLRATRNVAGYAAAVLVESFRSLAQELRGRPSRSP